VSGLVSLLLLPLLLSLLLHPHSLDGESLKEKVGHRQQPTLYSVTVIMVNEFRTNRRLAEFTSYTSPTPGSLQAPRSRSAVSPGAAIAGHFAHHAHTLGSVTLHRSPPLTCAPWPVHRGMSQHAMPRRGGSWTRKKNWFHALVAPVTSSADTTLATMKPRSKTRGQILSALRT
jgi:hypothetical protein